MSNKRNKKHFVITTGTLLLSMALLGCSKENIKPAFNEIESVQYESETALADTEKAENYEKKIEVISEKERELVEAEMDQAELLTDIDVETGELIVLDEAIVADTSFDNASLASYFGSDITSMSARDLQFSLLEGTRDLYYEAVAAGVDEADAYSLLLESISVDDYNELSKEEIDAFLASIDRNKFKNQAPVNNNTTVGEPVTENNVVYEQPVVNDVTTMTDEEFDSAMEAFCGKGNFSASTDKPSVTLQLSEEDLNTTFN